MKHYRLFIALILALATTAISAQTEGFISGNGTQENPWIITSRTHLQLVNNYLGEIHANKHFRLGTNINLGGSTQPWTPIGTAGTPALFYGTFDGAGYTISGLHVDNPDLNYQGLFGRTAPSATQIGRAHV